MTIWFGLRLPGSGNMNMRKMGQYEYETSSFSFKFPIDFLKGKLKEPSAEALGPVGGILDERPIKSNVTTHASAPTINHRSGNMNMSPLRVRNICPDLPCYQWISLIF